MSPQEFWLLLAELAPETTPEGPAKIGNIDRATFDELVGELNA